MDRKCTLRVLFVVAASVWTLFAAAQVDHQRILSADAEPGNWMTHGRTYAEDRESPLAQINKNNVDQLGLAWAFDTQSRRGLEATPLVVDGVMYSSLSWSEVIANDARTGELLWRFNPEVPRAWAANACCDVVNRGVAAWGDQIFVGTLDGRLIALDRKSGTPRWEVLTIDPERPYTITGAPRVVKGKVIIGNGGAEFGVRGYVSAYDAETGDLAWRFHTVPGDPQVPYSPPPWPWRQKLGPATCTGKPAVGAQFGIPWPTIQN